MSTQKFKITNRSGLKLVIQVDEPENPHSLVFIAHGQGGFKEQKHIEAFKDAFLENGFRVVRFDATNALGESDGDMMNVTYDNYVADLEDVIDWARTQSWFQQPFALCGHSMGAQSTTWYAEHHPKEVSLLAPMAPTVNHELYISTNDEEELQEWQQKGYKVLQSRSKPGVTKQVGWGVVESLKKFDLLPLAHQLTMPVLDVVGEFDEPCPKEHQEVFVNKIASSDKQLVVIPEVDHNYRNVQTNDYDDHFVEVKVMLNKWVKSNIEI